MSLFCIKTEENNKQKKSATFGVREDMLNIYFNRFYADYLLTTNNHQGFL